MLSLAVSLLKFFEVAHSRAPQKNLFLRMVSFCENMEDTITFREYGRHNNSSSQEEVEQKKARET